MGYYELKFSSHDHSDTKRTQEGAKRASTLIKLVLFYLSHTMQAKLGVGLGPASTTTTYARGAITFVAEKFEEDFEIANRTSRKVA